MNPTVRLRNSVTSPRFSRCSGVLKTSISPPSNSKVPAMTLNRVVLPQPDGPSTITTSPIRPSNSTPLSAWILASPRPKDFFTPRTCTARRFPLLPLIVSATEHHRWFEFINFADAEHRRKRANEQNHHEGEKRKLIRQQKRRLP